MGARMKTISQNQQSELAKVADVLNNNRQQLKGAERSALLAYYKSLAVSKWVWYILAPIS